ncbi:MAG: patatin-like phospholipase family protein [Rhodospirillales bacterium]
MKISRYNSRRLVAMLLLLTGAALLLQACSTPERLDATPQGFTTQATVLGIPNARFFPDEEAAALATETLDSVKREVAANDYDWANLPPVNFLAISGGGDDGAFGAGLLVGWTETGTRPEFKLVTGVSTGSLIAPFAFLGPSYDDQLTEVYTEITTSDVYEERGLFAAIGDDALSDTSPLFETMSKYMNETMLADIAKEYDKGRLLIIGTTNLDAQRPVLWNIGAIAKSGHPGALDLVRKILLASAAIPVAFPPVLIDVELDGQAYHELHVDGGAIAQLFLYPPALAVAMREQEGDNRFTRERNAYVIFNGRLDPQWASVERSTLPIAGRAVSTMIHFSALNDLAKIYVTTKRDGVGFNLASIEEDFTTPHPDIIFEQAYMRDLFAYGYELGKAGYPWQKIPPTLAPPKKVAAASGN